MALDLELAENQYAVCMLKRRYVLQSKNYDLNEIRLKMAKIPLGSKPIQNPIGSAPAVLIKKDETTIVCLPGVPPEMKAIFLKSIFPTMKKEVGDHYIVELNYQVTGVSEAMLVPKISEVVNSSRADALYIKTHPYDHVIGQNTIHAHIRIQIVAKGENEAETQRMADTVSNIIAAEISHLNGTITNTEKKFHN
jgi:molybdopterin-biosynthesis enzyme MoeA-like protein